MLGRKQTLLRLKWIYSKYSKLTNTEFMKSKHTKFTEAPGIVN